jgi:outer membrane lipoprotein-sorting protein
MRFSLIMIMLFSSSISLSQDFEGEDLAQQIEDEIKMYEGDYSAEFDKTYSSDERENVSEEIEAQEGYIVDEEYIFEE